MWAGNHCKVVRIFQNVTYLFNLKRKSRTGTLGICLKNVSVSDSSTLHMSSNPPTFSYPEDFRSKHRQSVNPSSWRVLIGNSNFRMETSSPTKMEISFYPFLWVDLLHIYIHTQDTVTHSKHFQHHIEVTHVEWDVSEESTFCTRYKIWFSVVLRLMGHVIWRGLHDLFCDNKCSMSSYLVVSLWLYKVVYVDRWWIVWVTVDHMDSMVVRVGTLDCSW